MQRRRRQEFIRFPNATEAEALAAEQVHVVLDNHAAHKHPKVVERLGRHPRSTLQCTPAAASWINAAGTENGVAVAQRAERVMGQRGWGKPNPSDPASSQNVGTASNLPRKGKNSSWL